MNPDFGYEDNMDARYYRGWRWLGWLSLSGFKWFRRWCGGRWELWWVEPCRAGIWHPVTCPSDKNHAPCPPSWGPPMRVEEYLS